MLECVIFLAFVLLAVLFDILDRHIEHRHQQKLYEAARVNQYQHKRRQVTRLRRHRRAVLILTAALSHPVTWHALHEYAVHLVVYSGKLLPSH